MPQPLVMYFTTCILATVEQLHAIRIIHADIKPDNFLLGERWAPPLCPAHRRKSVSSNGGRHGALLSAPGSWRTAVLGRRTWTTAWSSWTSARAWTWRSSQRAPPSPPSV